MDSDTEILTVEKLNERRFVTKQNNDFNTVTYKFYDGRHNYFYFYLGCVDKVPVAYEPADYWNGIAKPDLTYEITTYDEQTIDNTMSVCTSMSVSSTNQQQLNISGGFKKNGFHANIALGLSWSKTSESAQSTTQTTSTINKWSEEHKKTVKYILDDNCPYGYYRYTLFASCDVYAVVIYDKVTKETTCDYVSCARSQTYHYSIDYSEDEHFEKDASTSSLIFDFNLLKDVKLDEDLPISEISDIIYPEPYNRLVLHNKDDYEVVASGGGALSFDKDKTDWGLSHKKELIDLSDFSEYMSDKYEWEFNIKVHIVEEKDGYQELYIYNEYHNVGGIYSNDTYSKETAQQYGMVWYNDQLNYSDSNDDDWVAEELCILSGSQCRNKMYITYGAHGTASDTWHKKEVTIYLTIREK